MTFWLYIEVKYAANAPVIIRLLVWRSPRGNLYRKWENIFSQYIAKLTINLYACWTWKMSNAATLEIIFILHFNYINRIDTRLQFFLFNIQLFCLYHSNPLEHIPFDRRHKLLLLVLHILYITLLYDFWVTLCVNG